jgi:hypothetical protein
VTAGAVAMMIMGTEIEIETYKFVKDDDGNIVKGSDGDYDHVTRLLVYWLTNFQNSLGAMILP